MGHTVEDIEQGETPSLLLGVQTFTATLEINIVVSLKTGNQTTSSSSFTSLEHIPKGCSVQSFHKDICSVLFIVALLLGVRNWKQPRYSKLDE